MNSNQRSPPSTIESKRAPYVSFIFSLAFFSLGAGGVVLLIAFAAVQGSPDAFDSIGKNGGWLAGLVGAAIWAQRTWSEITRIEADTTFRPKHRSFMLTAGAAICAVLVLAAVVGNYLGIRAGHFAKIKLLTEQFGSLGTKGGAAKQRFIIIARRQTPTMPEYIQRCGELEAALNDYEPNLREGDRLIGQLLEELQYPKADARYAKLIPMATVLDNVFRKDMEGARAVRKEVEYAKQLADLSTSEDRARFYKANILPTKDDEDRIAHEEIEMLKDAKARGIKLPESMYRDVGIQK